jgi:murein DD-endopeptidase MepM/ murein hydrolase activator NlpD
MVRFFFSLALVLGFTASALPAQILNRRIQPRQTLSAALHATPLASAQVEEILKALEGVFDFKHARPGDQLRLVTHDGQVDFLDYRQSALEEWQVRREGDRLIASKRTIDVERRVDPIELSVDSSLYEAAQQAGEDPQIAMTLADVFAWDVDFYHDVRKGDHVRCLVEKFLSHGRLIRYGEVFAASYEGSAVGRKRVFRYELPDGQRSYFQEDGSSARKSFLKSPLKYAHVTSGFGSRFHPILQYVKAHNGVDYGTPVGTPVWAVADGTVTRAGNSGAGGNSVCVRHLNGWETCYLHLSGYGSGVHVGSHVSQKQVIAYSGNTGRSTGPHLHYALKRNGAFVNPLNQNFPRAEPVPHGLLAKFREQVSVLAASLDAPRVAAARAVLPLVH